MYCVCTWCVCVCVSKTPRCEWNNKSGQANKANQQIKWSKKAKRRNNEKYKSAKKRCCCCCNKQKKTRAKKTSLNYIFARRLFRLVFGRFGWHFVHKQKRSKETNFVFFSFCTTWRVCWECIPPIYYNLEDHNQINHIEKYNKIVKHGYMWNQSLEEKLQPPYLTLSISKWVYVWVIVCLCVCVPGKLIEIEKSFELKEKTRWKIMCRSEWHRIIIINFTF